MERFPGSSASGAQAWLWQRVTGATLVVLLVGHFLLKHFGMEGSEGEGITHALVVAQLRNPWWLVFELVFLVVALWHGLNGVWMVAADYLHAPVLRVGAYLALWIVGFVSLLLGLVTLLPLAG